MRHATRTDRLSRTSEHRTATLANMARNVLRHGRIHTTVVKAKVARRVVERLITLGKDGSVHSRRQAYRVLQDRGLVKKLFAEIAPQFLDCHGGYTRVLRMAHRKGDGAETALLELTRLPAEIAKPAPKPKGQPKTPPTHPPAAPKTPEAKTEEAKEKKGKAEEDAQKPKRFLEGIRGLFRRKPGGSNS